MSTADAEREARLTLWQRAALRRMLKDARKRPGEQLTPEDWTAYFRLGAEPGTRVWKRFLRSLPANPRCGFCGAPFAGFGSHIVRPLGYRPSRKNPHLCATCVELSPPGGMTMHAGILFADLRGFTALSEGIDPEAVSVLLRRFYACAEDVVFPEALIDKLIGDEVMALYVPFYVRPGAPAGAVSDDVRKETARVMLDHSRKLLAKVGYGRPEGPFVEVGVGLDFGEAFVGNIGQRAVYDFTAVGDVVNTASRLQGEARGGEILVSARLADELEQVPGEPVEVTVKGKSAPVAAYRITTGPAI
jgi:adenylate cyclase